MKRLILMLFIATFALNLNAQPPKRGDGKRDFDKESFQKKITTHKIAFITVKLDLSQEEAMKFWPIFNKYDAELKAIRDRNCPMVERDTTKRPMRPDFSKLSETQAREILNNHLKMEKEIIAVKEKYAKEFEKAIPVQKVTTLYFLEKEFMGKLMQKGPKQMHNKDKAPKKRNRG